MFLSCDSLTVSMFSEKLSNSDFVILPHILHQRKSSGGSWVTGWTLTSSEASEALCSNSRPSPGDTDTGWLTSFSSSQQIQVVVPWTETTSIASKSSPPNLVITSDNFSFIDTSNFLPWKISWTQVSPFLLSPISLRNGGEIWGLRLQILFKS